MKLNGTTYDGAYGERIVSVEGRNGAAIHVGDVVDVLDLGSVTRAKVIGFRHTPNDRVLVKLVNGGTYYGPADRFTLVPQGA